MPVDTTIQFNQHNSYRITDRLFCYPIGVQGMNYITHSFQAYSTMNLPEATRAKTKFFDSTGATIHEDNHAFAVTTVFGKIVITIAVPDTATQAQLMFMQAGTDWWIAEPKTEQGETATPYNVNYAGQLTYITPNGIYTGMITTEQIVVTGSIASPGETLDTSLVTINNRIINLSATTSSLTSGINELETRTTQIEAGQITLSSRVGNVEPKVTKITSEGIYTGDITATQITTGTLNSARIATGSITGVKLADGTITDVKIASGLSATKITTGTLSADRIAAGSITGDKLDVSTVVASKMTSGDLMQYIIVSPDAWANIQAFDLDYSSSRPTWEIIGSGVNNWIHINVRGETKLAISNDNTYLESDNFRLFHQTSGNLWGVGRYGSGVSGFFYVGSGVYDSNAIEMVRGNGLYALGVDSKGAYYRKNSSTKTYF